MLFVHVREAQIHQNPKIATAQSAELRNQVILASAGNVPSYFRSMCQYLFEKVSERFPTRGHVAVGGFVLVRFVCPAICLPHAFNLADPPPPHAARGLLLISKILQVLALALMQLFAVLRCALCASLCFAMCAVCFAVCFAMCAVRCAFANRR